jgi:hypothetical protein
VRVLRHADPVHVRMADSAGSVPMSFRRKELRVPAGSGVACSDGGRAEVLWGNGTSMILSGRSDGIVGSPSRGEPSFVLRDIEQVRFDPTTEDLYELMGGAMLRVRDGPVRVTRVRPDVLRVSNEAKHAAQITFLGETIVLDPGHAVDLPILSTHGAGEERDEARVDAGPVSGRSARRAPSSRPTAGRSSRAGRRRPRARSPRPPRRRGGSAVHGSSGDVERESDDASRVLITGGAGFLGSHLCERFLAKATR